jgi:hypothetical protein
MAKTAPKTVKPEPFVVNIDCKKKRAKKSRPWTKCMCQQLCAKIQKMENARKAGKLKSTPGARTKPAYASTKATYIKNFMAKVKAGKSVDRQFVHPCAACEYKKMSPKNPTEGGHSAPFNADHMQEAAWGANLKDLANFKMLSKRVNQSISFQRYDPKKKNKDQPIKAMASCECPDGPGGPDKSGCA